MVPYFRSVSQMVRSWFASPKRRTIRKQKSYGMKLHLEQMEARIMPSSNTIDFNLASPTAQVSASAQTLNLGTLTDTFVSGGNLANSAISINWGDGTISSPDITQGTATPTAAGSTTYTIAGSHTYATAGNYTVTVIDNDGTDTAAASAATTVNITPVAPASGIAINLTSPINNVPVSTDANGTGVNLGSFTDTNLPAGNLNNTTISINWGDGSAVQTGTALATNPPSQTYYIYGGTAIGNAQVHNYATAGPYTVTVSINDGVNSNSTTTTVNVAQPSAISFNPTTTTVATTNKAAISLGTLTDTNVAAGSLGAGAISIDWGDGSALDTTSGTVTPTAQNSQTYSIAGTHIYSTPGSYTVTVNVDDTVQTKSVSTTVNVVVLPSNTVSFNLLSPEVALPSSNPPPTPPPTPILGSFSDTNKNGFTSATVFWGDSTSTTSASDANLLTALTNLPGSYRINLDHNYSTFGTFTVTVQITDGTGTYTATTQVTVYSTQLAIAAPVQPITGGVGGAVSLSATLNDPNSTLASGQYAATVNWGDGTPATNATVTGSNGVYTITASHTYSTVGTYDVTVNATRAGSLPDSSTSANTTATINKFISATDWMQQLPDSLPLTDISMPGTHQSAAGPSLVTEITGDQNYLSEAKSADLASQIAGGIAIVADLAAAYTGEAAIPFQVAAAIADAAAGVADGTAATYWGEYAASFGSPKSGTPQYTLQVDASGLAAAEGADVIFDALGVGFHTAAAVADGVAEGEAWLNPFADAAEAITAVGAEGYDAAAAIGGGLGYFAAVATDYAKFEKDLDAAMEVVKQYQTQDLGITDQLNSGIRSLDIRGGTPVNGQIELYNGPQDTGVTLKSVLDAATAFLQANPSETIVLSLRSNEDAATSANFSSDLTTLLNSAAYNGYIYTSATPTSTPDLGQVRGKIVIIPYAADSTSLQSGAAFGWQPAQVNETPSGESDPANLWKDAEGLNQTAGLIPTDLGNPNTLYITNLGSDSPPEKTEPIGEADTVNANAKLLFGATPSLVTLTTGIVGIDNPDSELINDIISQNNMPIMVTSDADSGPGSLRAAIIQANSQPGVNTIEFASSLTGSTAQDIDLLSNLPVITSDLFIDDTQNIAGTNNLNINGGTEFLNANGHTVFQDTATHPVTEQDFVASDGAATVETPYSYNAPVYVVPSPTTTTISASANPAVYGQPLTYSVTVSATNSTPPVPTGSVQFFVDGKALGGAITLSASGVAVSPSIRFLTGSSHTVTVQYSSDTESFFNSTGTFKQTVQQIAVEPDPNNPGLSDLFIGSNGATSNDNINITPIGTSNTGSTGVHLQAQINGVNTSVNYTQSFNAIYMYLQNGSDNVDETNTLTIPTFIDDAIPGGNGNNNIHLGNSSGDVVNLGNGNDVVQIASGANLDNNETVTLGKGNDNVQIGNGSNDTVIAGGGADQVTIGSNNSTGLDNNETVTLGTGVGGDNVQIGDGSGDTVTLKGTGNDQVNIGSNNSTGIDNSEVVTATAATANVNLGDGSGDKVTLTTTGNSQVNIGNSKTGIDNAETVSIKAATANVQLGDGSGDTVSVVTTGNTQVNIGNNNSAGLDSTESVSVQAPTTNVRLGDGSGDKVTLAITGNAQVNIGSNNNTGVDSGESITGHVGTANIQLGDGSGDTVSLVPSGNTTVNIGSNNSPGVDFSETVTLGNGNDNVQIGNGNGLSTGGDTITLGNGNNNVRIGGNNNANLDSYNKVTLGTGSNQVQIGNGSNNTVTAGGGAGSNNVQLGDGGNDTVTITGTGNDQVQIGNNNSTGIDNSETVSVTGQTANVRLGDGSGDKVTLTTKGNAQLNIGSNNSTGIDGNESVTIKAATGNVQLGDGSGDTVTVTTTGNAQVNIGANNSTGLDSNETVSVTAATTNIQLGDGSGDKVTVVTTGNAQVNLGNYNTTGLDSNETVSLQTGSANVQLGDGHGDTVTGKNGNTTVRIGNNNTNQDYSETVTLGNGNDNVQIGDGNGLSTGGDTVTLGNGADNLQIGGGNGGNLDSYATVKLGTGADQVQIGNGTNNAVTSLNPNDNVTFDSGPAGTNNNTFTG